MKTNCTCTHSVYDHSDDTGCDAKGCTCSLGFEEVTEVVFNALEKEIDELEDKNHALRVRNDNEYDNALEWAASYIIGAQLSGHGVEVQRYANTMAMSIRAAKRGLTKRALDVCPSCAGKGTYQIGVYSETCSACHGTGTRQ